MPNATVIPPAAINVRVGTVNVPKVTAITYGARTLKSATDFSMAGALDGYSIVYIAETDSFGLALAGGAASWINGGEY